MSYEKEDRRRQAEIINRETALSVYPKREGLVSWGEPRTNLGPEAHTSHRVLFCRVPKCNPQEIERLTKEAFKLLLEQKREHVKSWGTPSMRRDLKLCEEILGKDEEGNQNLSMGDP